jgi:hypothetical protein
LKFFEGILLRLFQSFVLDHDYLIQQHIVPPESPLDIIVSQDDDRTSGLAPSSVGHTSKRFSTAALAPEIMQEERSIKIYRSRTPKSNEKSCPLDPNHTHFILLDDMLDDNMKSASTEIYKNFNTRADLTIKPRAEIEHAISQSRSILVMNLRIYSFRLF